MSFILHLHPEIKAELLSATEFYAERDVALAERFVDAVEAAFSDVAQRPSAHRFWTSGVRRYVLRRFPYMLLYQVDGDHIQVSALMHVRRDPRHVGRTLHERS